MLVFKILLFKQLSWEEKKKKVIEIVHRYLLSLHTHV